MLSIVEDGASAAHCQSFGQELRQTCFGNLFLRGRQIGFNPHQFDEMVFNVVNAIRRAPVSVAWWPDAAGVDEILFGRLDANGCDPCLSDTLIANKYHRHVCVAEKAEGGARICDT